MTKKKGLILGLNCTSDFSITDTAGKVYSVDEARAAWEAGKVEDYNLAFHRLMSNRFDLEATKAQFAAMK